MLTSPKLIDPFQVVRMSGKKSREGPRSSPAGHTGFLPARRASEPRRITRRAPSYAGGVRPAVEARDLDDGAGVRSVDELAAADVDADVAERRRRRRCRRAGAGPSAPRPRRSTSRRTSAAATRRPASRRTSRARAVEAARRGARPDIRRSEVLHRDADDAGVARGRHDGRALRVSTAARADGGRGERSARRLRLAHSRPARCAACAA